MSDHLSGRSPRLSRAALRLVVAVLLWGWPLSCCELHAQEAVAGSAYLKFVRSKGAELRRDETVPISLNEWQERRAALRAELENAWGGFPKEHAPLKPQILGTVAGSGYQIEKIVFQTLPEVFMTANAYVPNSPGRHPAVLCVHGHWSGAKQDPHVQARCIGLAKLGYFVLAVDAMGAGERGLGKALGEYHGEMVGATLWPPGRPLSGLQVYENRRAVDYLLTRPEVDGRRLGITGASGGGNQTMYAGAFDERFQAVVPVCSVGNYQAYLGAACCMCEVVPGALQFTEEWGVLSLTAPRALMVISATRDAFQFSVGEARKSLAFVEPVYELYQTSENVRHGIFESPHDYNREMREAMYGWMALHLKGEGDGSPIAEPDMQIEDPETLRCFPGQSRPDNWMTIPRLADREAREIVARFRLPQNREEWHQQSGQMRTRLDREILGGTQPLRNDDKTHGSQLPAEPASVLVEPGIVLPRSSVAGVPPLKSQTVIVLDFESPKSAECEELTEALSKSGRRVITPELRGTGALADPRDRIGRAPDHNSAEWALWLGRPLLGQWVMDVRTVLSAVDSEEPQQSVAVLGLGPAGIVALCAAAVDTRVDHVVSVQALSSYISDTPYDGQRLGLMAPGILRDVGDVPHIAALVAPRDLTIVGATSPSGNRLSSAELKAVYSPTRQIYDTMGAAAAFSIHTGVSPAAIIDALDR